MMIEDLYKTTEKLNKHIENMALNKVNIEFLRKQMDKVLVDIEKLKDANRGMNTQMGAINDRVHMALPMFVNGEIKEYLIQPDGMAHVSGKREAERQFSESVSYKCYKGKAEIELYQGRKYIKKLDT